MTKKNLPIKLILQKKTDIKNNQGGGQVKFFGLVTDALQEQICTKFEHVLQFYENVFNENDQVPAVGKITVKAEAIAKSHKPNDLCRCCSIIGGEDLNEIYIKVTRQSLKETISLVKEPPSKKFKANLTAIEDIQPIQPAEKITQDLYRVSKQGNIENVRNQIKIKLFDFGNEFDNTQIWNYVLKKLKALKLPGDPEHISYGEKINYLKVKIRSFEDVKKIASINGVKTIDFFRQYSAPLINSINTNLAQKLNINSPESEVLIGIIDGGISQQNPFLKPFIKARKNYVPEQYRNESHGTFIASMIQYGNALNEFNVTSPKFHFIDICAIPNSDSKYGLTDTIDEDDLMRIIEETMKEYASTTKIWNLSLGIPDEICNGSMSDLGIFLDGIQDHYKVQFFVSSGNLNPPQFREWPAQKSIGESDRIISPADSVRAITVGSLALHDSNLSIVKTNEPSPFSRRGPGANYTVKPDVVDYGGNLSRSFNFSGLGVKGLDISGNIVEGVGTSYSTPRIVQKYASIYDSMLIKDPLLAKALIIHSARMNSRELLDKNQDNIKYYGFGLPSPDVSDILLCSENEVTMIFKQQISAGTHLEMVNFPFPSSLIRDGKYFGKICMTLVHNPTLEPRFGSEYCRTNIDVSFGTYKIVGGKHKFSGQVPLECSWDEKFEISRVKNGFKWNPIKSFYRDFSKRGISLGDGWKIRIDMNPRNGFIAPPQNFVLVVTIMAPEGYDIYSEMVNGLRSFGFITSNLETKLQIRAKE